MAPKFKFTKEEVLTVTIDFIRENGIEALTARELAKKLLQKIFFQKKSI